MAAFGLPGGWEIWAILAVVLLLFGPTQLPKLAKMFGKSAKALKEGMDEGLKSTDDEEPVTKVEKPETPSDE
ncbi:MAG: twin-arginine translocase TatA/TatE family subunit [Coriobacteriia bacterium]|nr:twin-arginine translocase TatA/TatE family subunit [Coriobacteriia bacterium]